MSREIKFRAWNGASMEINVMAGFLGAFYVQGIDPEDSASMSPFNTKLEGVELMQFTGLHDRNGKEIYEGDIVTTTLVSELMTVEYTQRLCAFELYGVSGKRYQLDDSSWLEVDRKSVV